MKNLTILTIVLVWVCLVVYVIDNHKSNMKEEIKKTLFTEDDFVKRIDTVYMENPMGLDYKSPPIGENLNSDGKTYEDTTHVIGRKAGCYGCYPLKHTTGNYNIAIGYQAKYNNSVKD